MKRILVPTDFSQNAYSALFYATQLFADQKCQFYILNTFTVDTPILTSRWNTEKGKRLYEKLSKTSKEQLTEVYHSIIRDTEDLNHRFETISISKDLQETIQKTIKQKKINLVVMGTKGATGAKAYFIWSTSVKTIQTVKKCPVLMIPDQYEYQKPERIAFPTDLKRFYLEKELTSLVDFASHYAAHIHIFHINEKENLSTVQSYNFDALVKKLKGLKHTIHWISQQEEKANLIQDFIDQLDIDILVMIHYKHSMMEKITHEPIIKKIGFQPTIPFLVIPDAS